MLQAVQHCPTMIGSMGFQRSAFKWIAIILLVSAPLHAANDPLVNLRKSHPRLIVLNDQIKAVQGIIQTDKQAADTFAQVKQLADSMLRQATAKHVLIGPRLLAQSRSAMSIISTSAGMYRVTGDVRYADRAKKEMLAVAAFDDWNPSHFLDVAEMTNACGIGYDWIYDQLSPEDRSTIRTAIIEKGLKPGLTEYRKKTFWTDCNHNWGQVCAGGLTVGALSIADEEPDLAREILALTRKTISKPMNQFAPDGGWDEGPGYWNYATSYNVYYLAAIDSALGTDFGLEGDPGFSETALFHMQLTGPTHKTFNFADAGDGLEPAPQMFWFAKRFNRPEFAAWERASSAGHMNIFHLLWFDPDGQWPSSNVPLATVFKRVNVGAMRSSWTDPNAWFIAFKGGDSAANHSHLDLGTFVFDAMGKRWALDLGPDNYNLPGYFGQQRFTYFRLGTKAHNTICVNGQNQNLKAKAPITSFVTAPDRTTAIIDLSAAYPSGSVRRGIELIDGKQVLIQDEVNLLQDKPIPFDWNFHTPARVDADGMKAVLTLSGTQLRATLLSPEDGKFETTNSDAAAPQKPNPGITNLVVHCSGLEHRIVVLFSAVDDTNVPGVVELSRWPVK
jgi:hypothetical protein